MLRKNCLSLSHVDVMGLEEFCDAKVPSSMLELAGT